MRQKKLVAKIMTIALVAVMLGGCGSNDEKENTVAVSETSGETEEGAETGEKPYDGTELKFWIQSYGDTPDIQRAALDKVTADFKELTGITVDYNIVDWSSANNKITLACTGGEAPDVGDVFYTSSFVEMSSDECGLMEINDVVEEMGGEDTWTSAGKDEACVDGNWYGIPWRFDVRVLLYNTEDFEKAGITKVPETWDELVEVAQKLTEKDANGNVTHAGLAWNTDMGRYDQVWFSMLAQAGGSMMKEDFSEFTFDSEEGRKSLQFLADCLNKYDICNTSGALDASYSPLAEFMSGNVSMYFGATPEMKQSILVNAPQMEGKFASAPLPTATGKENTSVAFSAPIAIYKTTEHPEAAKEWVKYFCSEEVQLYISQEFGLLNANVNVMNNSYFKDDEWLSAYSEAALRSQSGDMPLATWSQLAAWPDGPIPNMCGKVAAGQDIDAAIKECLEKMEKIGY